MATANGRPELVMLMRQAGLWKGHLGVCVNQSSASTGNIFPVLEMSHLMDCARLTLRTALPTRRPKRSGMALLPNCMSGLDSFSKGLVFQLSNCNCCVAVEKIYFWTLINPRSIPQTPAPSQDVKVTQY